MTINDWRTIAPTDAQEYGALIDTAFGLVTPLHYLADFPVWDPTLFNQTNRFQLGGWSDGKLVATASLRFVKYRLASGMIAKLGLIGAVAISPELQGQGLGTKLLEALIAEGEAREVDALILWGAESPLYVRQGFKFGGRQVRSTFDHLQIEGELLEGFEIRTGWDEVIAEHLLSRKTGLLYQDADILWLSRHGSVEWRTLWMDGKCVAYCGWNRGIDLANLVHELGGSEIGMRTLLDFLSRRYSFLELLHHPSMSRIGVHSRAEIEFLAQFRIAHEVSPIREALDELWFSGMDSC